MSATANPGEALTFHGYFRSSAAYRCRIAFNLKGVTPQTTFVHLRKFEQEKEGYLAVNPHGLVPSLEVGGRTLTQSLAIIEWLDETITAPSLLPKSTLDRAHVRALALSIACDIHPLHNVRVLSYLKTECGQEQDDLDAWCREWIGRGLAAFQRVVEESGLGGAFCFGDAPTLADVCLVPQMFSARRFGIDLGALPTLCLIDEACSTLPAFASAHPSRQPDAEP